METLPIARTTLSDMVNCYILAEQDIRKAYALLAGARASLRAMFKPDSYYFDLCGDGSCHGGRPDYDNPDATMKGVKKDVWRVLVDRMELRRILSSKRSEELDKQIDSGEGLPEITFEGLMGMLEGTLANASTFLEESIQEVFEWLRPHHSQYKTNSEFEVGRKVIRPWTVRHGYSHQWEPQYDRRQKLTALDNVFHAMDGKGSIAKSYQGPLCDAICASQDGSGETEYFKFRCFLNGNLHLEFKRLDLLAKLNQVAGGMRLRAPAAKAA